MASILALKRRIGAAKNVSKTTKAMQMIAASKLKRAQDAVSATRPYVNKISEMTYDIMGNVDKKFKHPYLQTNNTNRTLLIALSPDKGLCGSLLTNLIREFISYQEKEPDTSYVVIGKKLEGKVVQINKEIIASFAFGTTLPSFDMVYPLMNIINEYYVGGKVSSVKFLTTEYTSIFTQTPKIITLLPLVRENQEETAKTDDFYIYEPEKKKLLESLLKHYVEMTVYQQLIESFVSEQAARMISMQNATNNANDIIEDLQLEYNKTRQAKITSEILDITGGAHIAQK